MITHTSDSHQISYHKKTKSKLQISKNLPKIQILEFCNNPYTWHTFWSCLIGCANMKWIRLVLWKIQSGHHFVHRQTDRRMERRTDGQTTGTSIPPFQLRWSGGYNESIVRKMVHKKHKWMHYYLEYPRKMYKLPGFSHCQQYVHIWKRTKRTL